METSLKRKKAPLAPATAEQSSQDAKRKPVMVYRVDDCSASIWSREHAVQGEPRSFYSVTFERSYRDRDGAWKYTKTFDPESLGKVVTLCQQCSEYLHGVRQMEAK